MVTLLQNQKLQQTYLLRRSTVSYASKNMFHIYAVRPTNQQMRQHGFRSIFARFSLDTSGKLSMVRAFILCYINYCSLVCHFCGSECQKEFITYVQFRALMFVYNDFTSTYTEQPKGFGCVLFVSPANLPTCFRDV